MISPIVPLDVVQREYPDAIFCDVRYSLDGSQNRQTYLAGHIPGARFVCMDTVLASKGSPSLGRHPLPTAELFAESLGRLGIHYEDTVIAYDTFGGRFAGRLVWMLRILGQNAALLDGGLQAWTDHRPDQPLEVGEPSFQTVRRSALQWPASAIATADEVQQAIASGAAVIDSRTPERYRGESEPLDPKAGHIPGASNLPFGGNYAEAGNYFHAPDRLRHRFQETGGITSETIFYCGSGVTACNNVLAAEAAGFPRPRVYIGSWSGWSNEDRPVAIG